MRQAIWKYELKLTDRQSITVPKGAKVLSAAAQGESLCIWCMVDPDQTRTTDVEIEIIGTGNPMPSLGPGEQRQFIGTVVFSVFVWHVFERAANWSSGVRTERPEHQI